MIFFVTCILLPATLLLAAITVKYYIDLIEHVTKFNQRQMDKFNRVESSPYCAQDDIFGNFEPNMRYITKCLIPFYGWIHLTKVATRRNTHV